MLTASNKGVLISVILAQYFSVSLAQYFSVSLAVYIQSNTLKVHAWYMLQGKDMYVCFIHLSVSTLKRGNSIGAFEPTDTA